MLRALNAGNWTEPGPQAPRELRDLWRRSAEVPFVWRQAYDLPETDPRFLDMTEEDMARDLLMRFYAQARARQADPNDPVGNELRARSSGAQAFLDELKAQRATYDRMAARWMNRHAPVQPRTVVRVITAVPEPRK